MSDPIPVKILELIVKSDGEEHRFPCSRFRTEGGELHIMDDDLKSIKVFRTFTWVKAVTEVPADQLEAMMATPNPLAVNTVNLAAIILQGDEEL